MNWIAKLGIVFGCSLSLMFSTPSLVLARSTYPTAGTSVKHHKTKKKAHHPLIPKKKATSASAKKTHHPVVKKTRRPAVPTKTRHLKTRRHPQAARPSTTMIERGIEPRPEANRPDNGGDSRIVHLVSQAAPVNLSHLITARSAMIMDAVTGETIYSQAPDTPGQPASTIKVLTGVISLDSLKKDEMVTVSQHAAMMPKAKVYLKSGKKYPACDLINDLLLASANDASVALAEKIAGSEPAFAQLMTAKARSFGATNTVCKTASGLTADGQHTTARDLARIFNHAMRNPAFAHKLSVTEALDTDGKVVKSHNRALWQVAGTEGGKTGYTVAARRTYVGKFKRGNDEIVVAMMGSDTLWPDVKKLVEYGFVLKRKADLARAGKPASSRMLVQLGNSHQLRRASSL